MSIFHDLDAPYEVEITELRQPLWYGGGNGRFEAEIIYQSKYGLSPYPCYLGVFESEEAALLAASERHQENLKGRDERKRLEAIRSDVVKTTIVRIPNV